MDEVKKIRVAANKQLLVGLGGCAVSIPLIAICLTNAAVKVQTDKILLFGSIINNYQNWVNTIQNDNGALQFLLSVLPTPTAEPLVSLPNILFALILLLFMFCLWSIGTSLRTHDALRYARRSANAARLSQAYMDSAEFVTELPRKLKPISNAVEQYDVFICHASEDKISIVRPLTRQLKNAGISVWYDETVMSVGDRIRQSIDNGLINSTYGIVVLSNSFFEKAWTQYELDGLMERQIEQGKVILPFWHGVSHEQVMKYSPSLAGLYALDSSKQDISEIVNEIRAVVSETSESAN